MAKQTFRTKKGFRVDITNAEEIVKGQPNFLDVASDSNDWDELAAVMEGTTTINFKRIFTADVELYFDEETGEEYLDVYVTSSPLASEEGTPEVKFYEINDPYYALIKATDKADAEKVYIESVANTDDYENFQENEIREVERDYALVMFSQTQDHDGTCAGYDFISKVFNDPDFKVLKMDGSLL